MTLDLTPGLLQEHIPNVIIQVDDETPLIDKILPYFRDTARTVTAIVGDIDPLPLTEEQKEIITRAVVMHAFAEAVPAIDLVLTPTGFGVVSTNTVAPASGDRITRLVTSLRATAAELLIQFTDILRTLPEWRDTVAGKQFCLTFLTSLRHAIPYIGADTPLTIHTLHAAYTRVIPIAARFEAALAEEYLGTPLMDHLLRIHLEGDTAHLPVVTAIREADTRYIAAHLEGDTYRCPDPHELYHSARPILAALPRYPEINRIWEDTMKEKLTPVPFKNKTQGGFFF